MAEALYMLRKKNLSTGEHLINGIHAIIVNDDDAQTEAQTIATVCAQLVSDGQGPFPSNYFDERVLLSTVNAPGTGALGADGDYVLILPRRTVNRSVNTPEAF